MTYEHRKRRPKFEYNGRTLEVRSTKYTPDLIRRVLDAYVEGERPSALSKAYDVPVSTVENWCRRAGVTRTRREAAVVRMIDHDGVSPVYRARRAAEMYRSGQSIGQVATSLGVPTSAVVKYLRQTGVKARPQVEAQLMRIHGSMAAYIATTQRICHMYHRQKMSRGEIVAATGHCYRTVAKALASKYNPWAETDDTESAEDAVRRLFSSDDYKISFTA